MAVVTHWLLAEGVPASVLLCPPALERTAYPWTAHLLLQVTLPNSIVSSAVTRISLKRIFYNAMDEEVNAVCACWPARNFGNQYKDTVPNNNIIIILIKSFYIVRRLSTTPNIPLWRNCKYVGSGQIQEWLQ